MTSGVGGWTAAASAPALKDRLSRPSKSGASAPAHAAEVLSPALAALLAAHRALEVEARSVAATATAGGRVPPRRIRALARALAAQQRAEEDAVLPEVATADPGFDPTALVADHDEVATAARALRADRDPATAVRLARLVALHHADEEAAVVPRWPLLSPAADRRIARRLRLRHLR